MAKLNYKDKQVYDRFVQELAIAFKSPLKGWQPVPPDGCGKSDAVWVAPDANHGVAILIDPNSNLLSIGAIDAEGNAQIAEYPVALKESVTEALRFAGLVVDVVEGNVPDPRDSRPGLPTGFQATDKKTPEEPAETPAPSAPPMPGSGTVQGVEALKQAVWAAPENPAPPEQEIPKYDLTAVIADADSITKDLNTLANQFKVLREQIKSYDLNVPGMREKMQATEMAMLGFGSAAVNCDTAKRALETAFR